MLRSLGTIPGRDVRTHDLVGRLGGDEFVVLLGVADARLYEAKRAGRGRVGLAGARTGTY